MGTTTRLAAFGAALAAVFVAAAGAGRAVGPVGTVSPAVHGDAGGDHATAPVDESAEAAPGLAAEADGYRLVLDRHAFPADSLATVQFRIVGPDRRTVTSYTREHEKELHLVLIRRDGSRYQHVHPSRDEAGVWSAGLTLPGAGSYKVFADFVPAGRETSVVVAGEIHAPGAFKPNAPVRPEPSALVDGYAVDLPTVLDAHAETPLTFSIKRNDRPVADLAPYLGAYGHLVVLRRSDLAYLHVHPHGDGGTGPDVSFTVETPGEDDYLLFFEFSHDGAVHTAAFTRAAR
ncbi:MAG TPA: hypothetical protein VNA12_04485 [Mycobacteriales bacterium]|nr:hypothetical protein [Mycobacteriales bacterium]